MAKTWSADNPKAALMARKRAVIVDAALKAFLAAGYAEASVNRIAAAAGVSIKTLYRHYEGKDDLFSAVMQAACGKPPGDSDEQDEPPPNWYALPPAEALPQAGAEYLRHVLSRDQLALYRVVVRDAHRFPELGRRYREVTTGTHGAIFIRYLDRWNLRRGVAWAKPTFERRDRRAGVGGRAEHAPAFPRRAFLMTAARHSGRAAEADQG
jgi:AcrR family transcriptional regulator